MDISKADALREINDTQTFYVNQLIDIIFGSNSNFEELKEIDFTSI